MLFSQNQRVDSLGFSAVAWAGLLVLITVSVVSAAAFTYDPIAEPIVSASFSADFAALTAHRTIAGHEVNFTKLTDLSTGLPPDDLSDDLFGTAAWPAPAQLAQGPLETGWVSAQVDPWFFPALAGGQVGIDVLFTDTDDAMFAIDTLILTIQTSSRTMTQAFYGTPVGNANNGFGIGIPDGGNLPGPLPDPLPPGGTGTGFDETISSKRIIPPEPSSLLLFGLALVGLAGRRTSRMGLRPIACITVVLLLAASGPVFAVPEVVVSADDCWMTDPDGAYYSFSGSPIPADFFGPGSEPFEGTIVFGGAPLDTNPPGVLEGCDTIVRRLEDTVPLDVGGADTVDIEILALSLVGTLTVNFGSYTEEWTGRACLSPNSGPQMGQMTLTRDEQDGGYFFASFLVVPRFYFTGPGGSPTLVLDCGDPQYPGVCDDLVLVNEDNEPNYWVFIGAGHIDPVEIGDVNFGSGIQFDGTCGPSGTTIGSGNTRGGLKVLPGGGQAECAPNKEAERKNLTNQKKGAHDKFRHNGKDCNADSIPDFCQLGACCCEDGSCIQTTKMYCEQAGLPEWCDPNQWPRCSPPGGGTFLGEGTKCEPEGACCLPNGTCRHPMVQSCCEEKGGQFMGAGTTSCPVPPCIDQLHTQGPGGQNKQLPVGGNGSIQATLEAQFIPVPDWEIVFTKLSGPGLTGNYTFTNGSTPGGTSTALMTDPNGNAAVTFTTDAEGPALMQVDATGTGLTAFVFFQITPARPVKAPQQPKGAEPMDFMWFGQ